MASGMTAVAVGPLVCFAVVIQVGVLLLMVRNLRRGVEPRRASWSLMGGLCAAAALLTFAVTGDVVGMLPALVFTLLVAVPLCVGMQHDSAVRPLLVSNQLLLLGVSVLIALRWFWEAPALSSFAGHVLYAGWLLGLAVTVLQVPYQLAFNAAMLQPLLRRTFLRPTQALPARREAPLPRVTVHVPCYAEPPGMVIATLEALNRQDYPAFDVVVVDSNTRDPALWRPVQAWCASRAGRFHFVHVDPLSGAKGGALNLALRLTPARTQLVAVLDADYVCAPDFLSRLVGFFDDPSITYVQTPHDYRDWKGNRFLEGSYWEERLNNGLMFPGLNEWGGALIIGTACLIRRQALEAAGGWSETCLTEDTELSLRLVLREGQGLFLRQSFSHGLLPQDFEQLKAQRFRWTAGPCQQLRTHWRALLTTPRGRSGLVSEPRWIHVFCGLEALTGLLGRVPEALVTLGLLGLLLDGRTIPLPPEALILLGMGVLHGVVHDGLISRLLGCGARSMAAVKLVGAALSHTRRSARLWGFSRQPLAWRRTSKFKASSRGWRAALASTREELLAGSAWLALSGAFLARADLSPPDLFLGAAVMFGMKAFRCFFAPLVALWADAELRKAAKLALSPARPAAAAPATAAACRTAAESSPAASPPP
ncbi:cellulose synthase 2 [Corallococcus coralloides DSM 2259]|uniref:Beta-monoglucosyldiacylglycerol synthase n=1 Tax=Corallococcus coralloides (strain ATCC 25202 / DSM 2259 / NBRC 100086 / M2) TaxID=1144275 RepID=H8MUJ1_CORCM|nr:glycosyltransferase [Corallococcus coralloides]AFE07966.1 cellulose synthase 2 [Corallococcus coralloides DSM 2259]